MPPRPAASAPSGPARASSRSAPPACSSSPTTSFRPNTEGAVHAFCHAIPDTWHQMGVILSATDSLNWLSRITGKKQAELSAGGRGAVHGAGRGDLPALSCLASAPRTTMPMPAAPSSGCRHRPIPAEMAQAVMEGVAFALRDCQRVLADAGTTIGRLIAVGGGSRSALWLKMLATNLRHGNRPARRRRFRRRAGLGASGALCGRPAPARTTS